MTCLASRVRILKKKNQPKGRMTSMIILTGFNFLMLKFPLAIIDLYGLVFRFENDGFSTRYEPNLYFYLVCRTFRLCESVYEIFYFFHLFSYIVQFFVFYKLDKNFKESFIKIRTRSRVE